MELHHVGIVVDSVERHGLRHATCFGLSALGPVVYDPIQDVRIQFWGDNRGTRVELIEPASENSKVSRFLAKGGGLHHLCYEVADIDAALSEAKRQGAVCACPPVPAVAIDHRQVCFVVYRDLGLVEFVEEAVTEQQIHDQMAGADV